MLERSGFFDKCDRDYMFPQVHDAVLAALEDYPEELEKVYYICISPISCRILFLLVVLRHYHRRHWPQCLIPLSFIIHILFDVYVGLVIYLNVKF